MEDINEYGVEFFKKNNKYHRILLKMAEKYKSIGSIGGSIELKNTTYDEKLILGRIDSKFINSKDAKFSVKKLIKTFEGTKLEGADFEKILNGYFGCSIKTNRELKENAQSQKDKYFLNIEEEFKGTKAEEWLHAVYSEKSFGYMQIIKEYEKSRDSLKDILINVMRGINFLTEKHEIIRLAIFASSITKDPHYFDVNTVPGKILITALSYAAGGMTSENAEDISELLYSFGLLKDEISNFTTCCNIIAYSNGKEHAGVKGFYDRCEPLQLNLYNLTNIDYMKCSRDVLFVFENPTVFSEVYQNTYDLKPSLLCTSGQFKLSSIILLNKVIENVRKIYYSGDFDPEGISMAYRLKKRYGEKVAFWRYDIESYRKIKSENKAEDRRMKQLDSVDDKYFLALIEELKLTRCCGYQELLVDEYTEDIKTILKNI